MIIFRRNLKMNQNYKLIRITDISYYDAYYDIKEKVIGKLAWLNIDNYFCERENYWYSGDIVTLDFIENGRNHSFYEFRFKYI